MIRTASADDAPAICEIYNYYVANTIITFDEDPMIAADLIPQLETGGEKHPWFVYEESGRVLGYSHASGWKSRCAYRYSVETSVYLDKDETGRGLGKALYRALIKHLRATDCHSLLAGIALPNESSVALHESLGFEKVGQFREVGRKFDSWIDVGYWELILT